MNIWIPYIQGGSGTDVFSKTLAKSLQDIGHNVNISPVNHLFQYFPWALMKKRPPKGTDIIVTNSWNGFVFQRKGAKMVTVIHLCVHDPHYLPYKSLVQATFHSKLVKHFESSSLKSADKVIAVSRAACEDAIKQFGRQDILVINNGIDVDFFSPRNEPLPPIDTRPMRLLFVGNLSRRKGADLLPQISRRLGCGFQLLYTSGLRSKDMFQATPGMTCLGRLDPIETRKAYQDSDLLLFPTRLEGYPLVVMEALACGTPVVGSNIGSMPEVVYHMKTGMLCAKDDVDSFVESILFLRNSPKTMARMRCDARADALAKFDARMMAQKYVELFESI